MRRDRKRIWVYKSFQNVIFFLPQLNFLSDAGGKVWFPNKQKDMLN